MYSCNDTPKGGLPHSDIHGSKPARGSPWLFAACHVLHRLLVPRHPPNALIILRSSGQRLVPPIRSGDRRQGSVVSYQQDNKRQTAGVGTTMPRGSQSSSAQNPN